MKENMKTKIIWGVYWGGIFIFFMLFFVLMHPILPFDTDDWLNIYLRRSPFPEWGGWNPIKVFPETIMPLCADISGSVIYKILGNYIESFKWVNAFVMSVMAALYIFISTRVFKKKLKDDGNYVSIMLGLLFLICHFLIFRSDIERNSYLLWEMSMTSYYNYILPDLLASILTLWLVLDKTILSINSNRVKNSIYIFLLYLSLNSNIFASVIPMAYIGTSLLMNLVERIRKRQFKIRLYIKVYLAELIFFLFWVISQVYEMNGIRATLIEKDHSLYVGIRDSVAILYRLAREVNKYFIWLTIVIFVTTTILVIIDKDKISFLKDIAGIIISMMLTITYLIIVCGRCGAEYLSRPGVFYGIAFYYLLFLMICLKYITLQIEGIRTLFPLLIFFMLIEVKTAGITFRESNIKGLSAKTVIAIDEQIIDQFVKAEKDGKDSIILYVPYFGEGDNFPIAKYGGNRISDSLYFHGVIDYRIRVIEVIPDKNWTVH